MDSLEKLLGRLLPRISRLHKQTKENLQKLSAYRLISFFTLIFTMGLAYYFREQFAWMGFLPLLSFGIFLFLIQRYRLVENFSSKLDSALEFYRRETFRSQFDLKSLFRADPILPEEIQKNHYWKDLDLFGKTGLYSYLDTTITLLGNGKFISQLIGRGERKPVTIRERQKIIQGFIQKKVLSRKLLRTLSSCAKSAGYVKISRGHYPDSRFYLQRFDLLFSIARYYSLFFWLGLFILFIMGNYSLMGILILFSLILYIAKIKEKIKALKKYETYFYKIANLKETMILLSDISLQSDEGNQFAKVEVSEMKKLFSDFDKIIFRLSLREAPLLNFLLNIFFQWDVWLLSFINTFSEKWQVVLESGIEKLEYIDSILPFVNFYFHQKNLNFPEIDENIKLISAAKLAHPLIPIHKRIWNPLEETKPGSVTLITGSNMSGKTTYLRTIGINCLLAMAGSPVLAENFRLPPLQILSSIKNEDSLEEGISFFYAEVRKISFILKSAKDSNTPSLILIDEVLKGTNTRERVIATEKILKELATYNAFNFITTHDLELAKNSKQKKWKLKHFEEQVVDGKMSFDYTIRDGVVNSSNALRILSLEHPEIAFVNN